MRNDKESTLKITRVTSTDAAGKETHGYVNLRVNPEVSDDDLLAVGTKLANLQAYPVSAIGRVDSCNLSED